MRGAPSWYRLNEMVENPEESLLTLIGLKEGYELCTDIYDDIIKMSDTVTTSGAPLTQHLDQVSTSRLSAK